MQFVLRVIGVVLIVLLSKLGQSQYYLRGEVRNEKGQKFPLVRILLKSKGSFPFSSGEEGVFGIPISKSTDTIVVIQKGYDTLIKAVTANSYQILQLQIEKPKNRITALKLSSHTKNLAGYEKVANAIGTQETYNKLIENEFVFAKTNPETGFSLNIDRASYSNMRRFINNDMTVPTDAVRIDEMLNYFDFKSKDYVEPTNQQFLSRYTIMPTPWNENSKLLYVSLDAPKVNLDSVPASNLVFLMDVSGSMDMPNRLPLIQAAFKLLANNIRAKDVVSIVVYGGTVRTVLPPTSGAEKQRICNIIDSLHADGETPGEGALRMAYKVAKSNFIAGGNNRIILATDGDFNVGQASESDLEKIVEKEKQMGIYLTCLGVGMGDYKDSKLETLSKKGNGNFAYLDNVFEAEKVLVKEFAKTVFTVANNAYMHVQWNADLVSSYRLIGFDNRKEAVDDLASSLEGGEIGSGHTITAVFEFFPTQQTNLSNQNLAQAILTYNTPQNNNPQKQLFNIPYLLQKPEQIDPIYKFATSVIMFGSILRNSKYSAGYSISNAISLAKKSAERGNHLQREFIGLMEKYERILKKQPKE